MIGLILTGHGEYAIGVGHALEMIAGKQEAFKVVPFRESEPMETLESNMKSAIIELQNTTEGIIVLMQSLNAGKEGIQHVVLSKKVEEIIENDEEGI